MQITRPARSSGSTPIWRDERFLAILGQVIFLAILVILLGFLARNLLANLRQQGMALGFDFLRLTSGFDIGEHIIPYDRSSTFYQALLVGLLNTILVSILGIFFATLLGLIFGIARLSSNFLVQLLARSYIEFLRNIPLLVLLIFLYTAVFIKFPRVQEATILPGSIMFTNRGVALPWGIPTEAFSIFTYYLGIGTLLAIILFIFLKLYERRTGRLAHALLWALLIFAAVVVAGWFLSPASPLVLDTPRAEGLRLVGGQQLSPEFMALLVGLAIYTSAFIADVVRAGIQSVTRGQIEASRSLGFKTLQSLQLIVLPQALRVIVPPLTSQYLNLIKNSSLAVAIGYPELFRVSGTILNQSGRAVEMIAVVMGIYLSISLLTSAFMNWYNRRVRLVER